MVQLATEQEIKSSLFPELKLTVKQIFEVQ